MIKRIIEFLLPSNSNAKNRNGIFLLFLSCFVIAMIITFINGYYYGVCDCAMKSTKFQSDSVKISMLEKRVENLIADSTNKFNQLKALDNIAGKSLYTKIKETNDPSDLMEAWRDVSLDLKVRDTNLSMCKNIIAKLIWDKANIIAGQDTALQVIEDKIKAGNKTISLQELQLKLLEIKAQTK